MAKDPAVLIYFDKWISSTNGLRAEFRAWYFDLLIYQYDKGSIPNDEDEIAGICRVRPSEYELFKQMLKQVLEQKFKLIENKYINPVAEDILRKRENFKEKRSRSGDIGVVIKLALSMKEYTPEKINRLKNYLFKATNEEIEQAKNKQVLEQLLMQNSKLYINEDVNEDKDVLEVIKEREEKFKETIRPFVETYGKEMCIAFFDYWTEPNKSNTKMRFEQQTTWEIKRRLKTWANNNKQFSPTKTGKAGIDQILEINKLAKDGISND